MQKKGNKYGTHRVIEPKGVLPQPANKLDNNMDEIWDNEILIDVQTLNIDSASFTDIHNYAKEQAGPGASEEKIMEEVKKEMLLNVELQGKHRNRRTGSGGMLLGKVEKIGDALKGKIDLILGNHDRLKIKDYYEMGFHRVYDRPILYDGFYIMSHAPIQWIKDGLPFYNCFGHVHNMELYKTTTMNSFCCCVERHGYRPIPFSYVKNAAEYMNEHPETPAV
jgi:hypothetical protein